MNRRRFLSLGMGVVAVVGHGCDRDYLAITAHALVVPSQYFVCSDLRVFSIACQIAFANGETGKSFTLFFRSNSRPPGVVRLTLPRTEDHLRGARVATRIILRSTGRSRLTCGGRSRP